MEATALARIINDINRKYLEELCGKSSEENGASRRIPPSEGPTCGGDGCFGGLSASPCFCGTTNHGYHTGADFEDVIILRNPASNPPQGKVAVVATIDDATKPNGEDRDLPVVLAVGINYGQMGSFNYLSQSLPLRDATGMRRKLDSAVMLLGNRESKNCVHPEFPKLLGYHLVATNFFPWITQNSWSGYGFNSIEEMLLIQCHGFRDPFAHIKDICQRLGGALAGLVFHGANNAVPYLGAEFLRTRMASEWKVKRPDIVFCDNLAGSANQGVINAVRLCGRYQRRSDMPESFPE